MNEPTNVVRLVDLKPGFAIESQADLVDWALSWLGQLERDGNVRTLLLVVETTDGQLYRLTQSLANLDHARTVGLLHSLIHRIQCGDGHYPEKAP